jgi:hypothetical protein
MIILKFANGRLCIVCNSLRRPAADKRGVTRCSRTVTMSGGTPLTHAAVDGGVRRRD